MVEQFGFGDITVRLVVFVVVAVFLFMMVEPEKLLWLSYLTGTLVVSLVVISTTFAIVHIIREGESVQVVEWSAKNMSISSGYVISSMEVINYILNVRRMMSDKKDFLKVGYSSLYFCGFLYFIPSLFIYLAYTDSGINELYYKTFLHYLPIKILNYFMNLNFLYGMLSFTIYNMEFLEKIRSFKTILRDDRGELRSWNVLFCRLAFLSLVLTISYFLTDLRLVYAINGIFLNSFIGLIIPGYLGLTRIAKKRSTDTAYAKISDLMCIVCGLFTFVLFFVDLVWK